MEIEYIPLSWALTVHDIVLKESGGLKGLKDVGQLESVLAHIKNNDYYLSIVEKAAHLIYSIAMFHVFSDGNKRTALAIGVYFLTINGYTECHDKFYRDMEALLLMLAEKRISKEQLQVYIECIIFDIDYPEALKLRLINYINESTS